MSHWHQLMRDLKDLKYDEQMARLMNEYGFPRAHANALVLWTRGSKSSQRFDSHEAYFASLPEAQAATARRIFSAVQARHPDLEPVIAWNQPMLKSGRAYVFGLSASKNHLTIAPFDPAAIDAVRPLLEGYVVNKKTVRIPSDWDVDEGLLDAMIRAVLADLE